MPRGRRDDAGVTTVEFALVLPVFVLLIGIATYFGWLAFVQSQLDRAANRAARFTAVPLSSGAAGNTYSFCQDLVLRRLNSDLVGEQVKNADLTITDALPTTLAQNSTCAADGSSTLLPQGFVKVEIVHDFANPFAYLVAPFTNVSTSLQLKATGQARVERR
jgi:Flp pilus assembly protein TadG